MSVDILFASYRFPFSTNAANNEEAAAKAAAVNADSGAPTMYLHLTLSHYCRFKVIECAYHSETYTWNYYRFDSSQTNTPNKLSRYLKIKEH